MDVQEQLKELKDMLALLVAKVAPPKATVSLTQAAELCNVEKRWLLERVQCLEIPAYRSGPNAPWRVYVADVAAFLTRETNLKPARRRSVLKRAA